MHVTQITPTEYKVEMGQNQPGAGVKAGFGESKMAVIPAEPRSGESRNPYSRWWIWIPGSRASLAPRNDGGELERRL
jgi:hypothetical protein